jgi:hypothetical protein
LKTFKGLTEKKKREQCLKGRDLGDEMAVVVEKKKFYKEGEW